jgi:hypothetical protein
MEVPRPERPRIPRPQPAPALQQAVIRRVWRNERYNSAIRRYNNELWRSREMDRRFRWILPVDACTGMVPTVPLAGLPGLPRTYRAIMALTTAQWVAIGAILRLDIRPGDPVRSMRNVYGWWLGLGDDWWLYWVRDLEW